MTYLTAMTQVTYGDHRSTVFLLLLAAQTPCQ